MYVCIYRGHVHAFELNSQYLWGANTLHYIWIMQMCSSCEREDKHDDRQDVWRLRQAAEEGVDETARKRWSTGTPVALTHCIPHNWRLSLILPVPRRFLFPSGDSENFVVKSFKKAPNCLAGWRLFGRSRKRMWGHTCEYLGNTYTLPIWGEFYHGAQWIRFVSRRIAFRRMMKVHPLRSWSTVIQP